MYKAKQDFSGKITSRSPVQMSARKPGSIPHHLQSEHSLLKLQRQQGNRYVQDLIAQSRQSQSTSSTQIQTKLMVGAVNDIYEQEADRVATQVMQMPDPGRSPEIQCQPEEEEIQRQPLARTISPLVQRSGTEAEERFAASATIEQQLAHSQTTGSPLPDSVRSFMEPRFGNDLSQVRVHTDSSAIQMNQALGAQAFTHGQHIYYGAGKHPGADALTAHELTHVVQQVSLVPLQRSIQRQAAPPTSLGSIPAVERRQMQASTMAVPSAPSDLKEMFATTPAAAGGATVSYSVSATVSFSANIPTTTTVPSFDIQRGLRNVGGWLMNQTNALPLNNTLSIQLDLTPFGGTHSIYRFSYYDIGKGSSAAEHLLIEQVATAPTALTPQTVPTGTAFQVGGRNFRIGSGWSQTEFTLLSQALGMLPASALPIIENVEFLRASTQAGSLEAGHYDPATNAITIRTNAFGTSIARFGTSAESLRVILHEIGHALDYAILNLAWSQYQSSGKEKPLLGTRSPSGQVNQKDSSGNFAVVQGAQDTDFRKAVQKDQIKAGGRTMPTSITTYGSTNFEESFAEAFALYTADPATLRELRPSTYAYFRQKYP